MSSRVVSTRAASERGGESCSSRCATARNGVNSPSELFVHAARLTHQKEMRSKKEGTPSDARLVVIIFGQSSVKSMMTLLADDRVVGQEVDSERVL
jgi:hypothetical protein